MWGWFYRRACPRRKHNRHTFINRNVVWGCYVHYHISRPEQNSRHFHYDDVIMGAMASQITSLTIVYSTVNSGADERKHQSSASLAFVWGSHREPVNSPHKWPVTRKMFPFNDVIVLQTAFKVPFLGWKSLCFDSNFSDVCSSVFHKQPASNDSGNGLASHRHQGIT